MNGYRLNLVSNALLRLIEAAGRGRDDWPPEDTRSGVRDLIRTIWLASFGLALLDGLFATKVVSAPIPERPTVAGGPTVPGTALLRDTLTRPDKTAVSNRGT